MSIEGKIRDKMASFHRVSKMQKQAFTVKMAVERTICSPQQYFIQIRLQITK